jgi:hypothetical protein
MGKMKEIYMEIVSSPEYLSAKEPERQKMLQDWQQYTNFKNGTNGMQRPKRETNKRRR